MATRSEVDSYQSVIDGISAVAFAQVKALLLSLDTPNPIAFRDALLATYPELMAPFLSAASEVAAQWYAELRGAAGIGRAVRPFIAPPPPQGQLDATVRYSLTPLFRPQEFIGSGILELLAGATQKLIANQGRDTILGSSSRDSARSGVARIPRAGCCAFCAMLASRGPVYSSKTAGFQAHNFCRCVAAPVFVGGDNTYVREIATQYAVQLKSTDGLSGSDPTPANLAVWRQVNGTK